MWMWHRVRLAFVRRQGHRRLVALREHMDGKGNPKNIQNQLCHSPTVKAMTQSRVERQDSQDIGDQVQWTGL